MKRIVNIYFALFLLYNLQGTLYTEGSIISRLLLMVVLLISLYFWGYALFRTRIPKPLKILSFMLAGWTLYGIWPILFGMPGATYGIPSFTVLKSQYISLLPIFVIFVFSRQGWLTAEILQRWTFIFLAVAITSFLKTRTVMMNETDMEEITNNSGYALLSILPLLPLFKKRPLLQYIILGVCMSFVLLGFKRGAIVIGALCSLWFLFISLKKNTGRSDNHFLMRYLLTIVIMVGAVFLVQHVLETSDYFSERVQRTIEGDTSNRDIIYSTILNHFLSDQNLLTILFGNGAYGSLMIASSFAHNDWLEIAIDNGLIYVFLYASFWISLFAMIIKGEKNSTERVMLSMFVLIYFLKTLFSMSYNSIPIYAATAFGYALANYEYKQSISG